MSDLTEAIDYALVKQTEEAEDRLREVAAAVEARLAEAERLLREVCREEFDSRGMTPRVRAIERLFGATDIATPSETVGGGDNV